MFQILYPQSTFPIESRQIEVMEEMEVAVASTSSTHTVTSAGDTNRKYVTEINEMSKL
jgi:hypothetical protein